MCFESRVLKTAFPLTKQRSPSRRPSTLPLHLSKPTQGRTHHKKWHTFRNTDEQVPEVGHDTRGVARAAASSPRRLWREQAPLARAGGCEGPPPRRSTEVRTSRGGSTWRYEAGKPIPADRVPRARGLLRSTSRCTWVCAPSLPRTRAVPPLGSSTTARA